MHNQSEYGWKNWSFNELYFICEPNNSPHSSGFTELTYKIPLERTGKLYGHQSDIELFPYTQTYAVFPCTHKPSALFFAYILASA